MVSEKLLDKMWSGPNMRYNTVILFEGLGKKINNESKDGRSLGTGL
jgi:hypothetical protein